MTTALTRDRAQRFALLAPIGAALFTLTWFVLGFISPGYRLFDLHIAPYSAISQPISGLGLGVTAPYMNTGFIFCGLLMIVGVLGIGRAWPAGVSHRARNATVALLACTGVGMIIDGLFTLEFTMLHLTGFLLCLGIPAIGFIVAGIALRHTWRRLSLWLLIAGPLTAGLLVLFLIIFDPYSAGDNVGVAGLVQRILATVALGTVGGLGVTAWRNRRSEAPRGR